MSNAAPVLVHALRRAGFGPLAAAARPARFVRSRRFMWAPVLCCALAWPAAAFAGPELGVQARVRAASSVLEVQVTLRDRPSVATRAALKGAKVPGDVRWLGSCLPHKGTLKAWLKGKRKHAARRVWKRALSDGSYRAILFVAGGKPVCGVEAQFMRHTSLSPAHGLFREALRMAIRADRARARPGRGR